MTEPKAQPGWLVVDHFIQGCTPEMIDWWWVNMEKGYELWCPDEHKGFKWEVPPPLGKHVGALQIAKESIDYGPVRDLRIAWLDPNSATPEIKDWLIYEHVLTAGGTGPGGGPPQVNLTHQWEAVPGGCKMRLYNASHSGTTARRRRNLLPDLPLVPIRAERNPRVAAGPLTTLPR